MDYLVHPSVSEEIDNCEADPLTGNIIGAIDVHRALVPGLLESAYEACLVYELRLRQLKVEAQKNLPILRLYRTCASPHFSQTLGQFEQSVVSSCFKNTLALSI